MSTGLTPRQEIVEVAINNTISGSLRSEIDAVLAAKPLHRIVSVSIAATEEYGTAAIALLVIEYLEPRSAAR